MRRITAASAFPPSKPAHCGCPDISIVTGCWRSTCSRMRSRAHADLWAPPASSRRSPISTRSLPPTVKVVAATGVRRRGVPPKHNRSSPSKRSGTPIRLNWIGVWGNQSTIRPGGTPMTAWPVHARITGPIVMIGFGSIGKGTLPLIERHFDYDKSRFVVIDPEDKDRKILDDRGIRFIHRAVTRDNYRKLLGPLLTEGGGQGFCVNLSVDTSSVDIMEFCREIGAFYIATVADPWAGFYFDSRLGPEARSNYALRETLLAARRKSPGGTTAVSCCGANPGMVSWFVKQALLNIANDLNLKIKEPKTREDWGKLAKKAGVKGIHIAERDTQRAKQPK